jgi:predicted transcriptional regulator
VLTVRDIMTPEVVTIHCDKLVCEVEGIFVSRNISAAPLVDEYGDITGFISKSDINRFHFTDGDPNYTKAWEIASPNVTTIEASTSIEKAANFMVEKHLHRLLVVDSEGVAGLLSSFDFIRLATGAWKADKL